MPRNTGSSSPIQHNSRSTSVSSVHRKDLAASRSTSPKTSCSSVTGSVSTACQADTSSLSTATKAQSQQPSHLSQCNLGSSARPPSSDIKKINPVDLKGASLVATSYANSKVVNRCPSVNSGGSVYYTGAPRSRSSQHSNNGTYRNSFQSTGRKYNNNSGGSSSNNSGQYTRSQVDSVAWSMSPPGQTTPYTGQEAAASPLAPVIPFVSLSPAQLSNYCPCVFCQTTNGTFLSNHSYLPAFPYYQSYFQPQQLPPNAMPQAYYSTYLPDGGQIMYQPQFTPPPDAPQAISYASSMQVRPPPLMAPKVPSPLPFSRVPVDKSPTPRTYDYSTASWLPPNQSTAPPHYTSDQASATHMNTFNRYT